ncbi:MAG: hypothetical protein K9M98_13740 [Cephaloticoccus sp.]|nr:hypothetical protein [Cephaloticoccus sp.]MCF7761556.1 hypothetical protein [Cephaloticoccus sp.]
MPATPSHRTLPFLRHLLASGSVILVLLLGLMSVSPTLHNWVHGQTCESTSDRGGPSKDNLPNDGDHGCAVVGFAHGLTLAVDTAVLGNTTVKWQPIPFPCPHGILPVERHFRLPPGRAPPASLS